MDQTCVEGATVTTDTNDVLQAVIILAVRSYLGSGTCSILSPKMVIISMGRATIGIRTQIDRTNSKQGRDKGLRVSGDAEMPKAESTSRACMRLFAQQSLICNHHTFPQVSVSLR